VDAAPSADRTPEVADGGGAVVDGMSVQVDTLVATAQMQLNGKIYQAKNPSQGIPAATVTVTVRKPGAGSGTSVSATSIADGNYQIDVPVDSGDTLVVSYNAGNKAPGFRTLKAHAAATATLDIGLAELAAADCSGSRCAVANGTVSVDGLPNGTSANLAYFNPKTDLDLFPGAFKDSTGALLLSGAFMYAELKDPSGKALDTLSSPALLHIEIAPDNWGVISDVKPGDDRIQVPLYAFVESSGVWEKQGEGYLVDASGAKIAEGVLTSVHGGTYAGKIFAQGEVSHFSYWNIDWPISTRGCVTGKVVDSTGAPVEGAAVHVGGATYTSRFDPVITDKGGVFCVEVMRSEGTTEDVDGNGVLGEKHPVAIRVGYKAKYYDMGLFEPTSKEAQCSVNSCTDLGNLTLLPAREIQRSLEGLWNSSSWGQMLFRKMGAEYWGAYTYDTGTVIVSQSSDGVFRGWWAEGTGPRDTSDNNAGNVEFRLSWNAEQNALFIDGHWQYGESGDWHEDWDMTPLAGSAPQEIIDRFNQPDLFKRHP
jgi:hypothetical protein